MQIYRFIKSILIFQDAPINDALCRNMQSTLPNSSFNAPDPLLDRLRQLKAIYLSSIDSRECAVFNE